MGSVSLKTGDGTARFKRASLCSSAVNLLMIFSVMITNLFALYAFTYSPNLNNNIHHKNISLISHQVSLILREIDSSQKKLARMEKELLGYDTIDISRPNIATELKLYLQRHSLPLGKDSRTGITEMVASVGHSCDKSADLLSQYMNYKPVSDKIASWSGLGCKSFQCLSKKKLSEECGGGQGFDCFDFGEENHKYVVQGRGKNDFLGDDVLRLASGGIRIGLDIGTASSGTFAATMAERNVTVITNTLNVDAPFSDFVAARGLFPLYLSLDHRFPFYDNVFDLVHASSAAAFDFGTKPEKLEFLMFDIDRILRAGGLFWLDNLYCANDDKKWALTHLIDKFGYKKLKWVVGDKVDSTGKPQVYLSALLQKPARG
ncbi:Probable methyltransferase At1g29790 [Linum grandiflorum]